MNPVDEPAKPTSSQADKLINCTACKAVKLVSWQAGKPVSCESRNRDSFGIRSFQVILDTNEL
jgi:hypothetical protein